MKKIFLTALFAMILVQLFGQQEPEKFKSWYVGINPASYLMAFPLKEEIKRFGPIAAGNEYGFNIVAGRYFTPRLQTETRLSLGNIHQLAFVGQLHAGVNYHFLLDEEKSRNRGIYAGAFVKYWDYYNRLTHVHFHHLSPYLTLGYQFNRNPWMLDLRLNQTVMIHSWSSMENTSSGTSWFFSPWPAFIPVLPTFSLTLGYHF
jgi:hypothetical protein